MSKFKKGERVKILNQTLSGKEIVEGYATLIKKAKGGDSGEGEERWVVHFDGDPKGEVYTRSLKGES